LKPVIVFCDLELVEGETKNRTGVLTE